MFISSADCDAFSVHELHDMHVAGLVRKKCANMANLSKRQKHSDVAEDFIPETGSNMAALYLTSGANIVVPGGMRTN